MIVPPRGHDTDEIRSESLSAALLLSLVDSWYFGRFVFTPYNFVQTNLTSVSLFYGQNPWHYYLVQALPILCTSILPFAVEGWYRGFRRRDGSDTYLLSVVVLVTIGVYSCAGHKEWRFIHPLLPILNVFASKTMVDSYLATKSSEGGGRSSGLNIRRVHVYLVLATLPASFYILRHHGRGQLAVMAHLRTLPLDELRSVGFLMPCHSTPWQSHFHRPEFDRGNFWALGCEPPLGYAHSFLYPLIPPCRLNVLISSLAFKSRGPRNLQRPDWGILRRPC